MVYDTDSSEWYGSTIVCPTLKNNPPGTILSQAYYVDEDGYFFERIKILGVGGSVDINFYPLTFDEMHEHQKRRGGNSIEKFNEKYLGGAKKK